MNTQKPGCRFVPHGGTSALDAGVWSSQTLDALLPGNNPCTLRMEDRGGTVVKVLCYKPEGHWFDPRW